MIMEIYVHCYFVNYDFKIIKEMVREINIQQDIVFFHLIEKKIESEGENFELSSFYSKLTYPVKNNFNLPNLITITDATVYYVTPEKSIGTHFSNSFQIGLILLREKNTLAILKYELMREAIQIGLNKYFGHKNSGCFFDRDTKINNTKLCDFCSQEIHSLGFTKKNISNLHKFLNIVKNEYFGIQKSTLFSVIIMDIVGYSKYTDTQQKIMIEKLQSVITSSEMIVNNLQNIIFLPTGDGCVIALDDTFYSYTIKLCSNIQKMVRDNKLSVRYGLNFGSIFKYRDLNNNINIAGSGINMAARVMDIGDGNHIIANRTIYDALGNLDNWHRNLFHKLGKIHVKHGVELDVYNIYSDEEKFGNAETPKKMSKI